MNTFSLSAAMLVALASSVSAQSFQPVTDANPNPTIKILKVHTVSPDSFGLAPVAEASILAPPTMAATSVLPVTDTTSQAEAPKAKDPPYHDPVVKALSPKPQEKERSDPPVKIVVQQQPCTCETHPKPKPKPRPAITKTAPVITRNAPQTPAVSESAAQPPLAVTQQAGTTTQVPPVLLQIQPVVPPLVYISDSLVLPVEKIGSVCGPDIAKHVLYQTSAKAGYNIVQRQLIHFYWSYGYYPSACAVLNEGGWFD